MGTGYSWADLSRITWDILSGDLLSSRHPVHMMITWHPDSPTFPDFFGPRYPRRVHSKSTLQLREESGGVDPARADRSGNPLDPLAAHRSATTPYYNHQKFPPHMSAPASRRWSAKLSIFFTTFPSPTPHQSTLVVADFVCKEPFVPKTG